MRWTAAAAGLVAATIVPAALSAGEPVPVQTAQAQSPSTGRQAPEAGIRRYLHPVRKFTLAVPPGAELAETGEAAHVRIQSRKGFRINIQTGDADPAVSLPQRISRFDAKYLGQGKPWSQKIGQEPVTVAGLEAISATYEGAGTQGRVVVVRGVKTDFVFMFVAPQERFDELDRQFQWVLANFQPNPADHPATAGTRPAGAPALSPAGVHPKRFEEPKDGYYTIQYPGDWDVTRPAQNLTMFSGKQGTEAFQAIVMIEDVRPTGAKTPAEAAQAALADLKATLTRQAGDLAVVGEQALTYKNGRLSLPGRRIDMTYTYAGQRYRKWVLVVPRPAAAVAHIWSYTAPEAQFAAFRPFAEAMLKSWTIRPGSG